MSGSEHYPDSPLSQSCFDDDEIVWTHGPPSDTDFIVLRHPLLDARSLPSTLSDITGHLGSDGDLSSALDKLSLCDHDSFVDSSSTGAESDSGRALSGNQMHTNRGRASRRAKRRAQSSSDTSSSSEYHSGIDTPTASYDDASAFISRYISSPVKGGDAELNLLRAIIIELGLRSPNASDLPSTLTSARKFLKAEAHVNIKEYVATRDKGQSALRMILKPSKNALRNDIRKGNKASLKWVKRHGLQVLLVTCFT
ncbi:hypothetical protein JVT61DRAFT_2160 [Boletus reticuloceps]|uniref:Uncharacterized protein n=1 Tax=Boletus reticuloceps TaxID=495285 RepID=A0A8I2YQG6_9AGAM|nr:hypothetical protein JVT61DRAFT_2160 [Boletus reticuloceps]